MENLTYLQNIVKHLVNGTSEESLCRICLLPLGNLYEDIYTTICKEDKEYCIADVLEQVCDIKILNTDESKVCASCFVIASQAYKFFLFAKRSQEILSYYVEEISNQIDSINLSTDLSSDSLCLKLPVLLPDTFNYDFDINKFPFKKRERNKKPLSIQDTLQSQIKVEPKTMKVINCHEFDSDIVIIMNDDGVPTFYKPLQDGSLILLDTGSVQLNEFLKHLPKPEKKKSRNRKPMEYKMCSRCPVRYRYVRKLKEHMKEDHGIDLFLCKVCQAVIEDEQEFNNHLQTHTGIHTCAICNMVFKKRETIISHLQWHEEMKAMSKMDGAHVCEICGLIFKNEEDLNYHHEKKHVTKYTCYYCGRMYKGELSFELHIKKHEMKQGVKKDQDKYTSLTTRKRKRKYTCPRCNRDFVDERALLWHERLHTNERPYVCDVCGRGFVSLNRRNQHAVCAHTAPARRCPLCPALFHLRSMVNTHIKKVHLKATKRRNRTSKHQNVFWKTEPVPIQELSVSIQNEILELQAAQGEALQKQK